MGHLDAATMIDLVEQRLSRSECEGPQRHIADCRDCAAEFDTWWTFLAGLGPSSLTDAPKDLVDECIAMYPKSDAPSFILDKARVVFDSFFQPLALAGLRGEASAARQLVIRLNTLDIHLTISDKARKQTIHGQLLPTRASTVVDGAQVQLSVCGQALQTTCANKFGEFRFSEAPSGSLDFSIEDSSARRIARFSVHGGHKS